MPIVTSYYSDMYRDFSDGDSRLDYGRKLADVEEADENEMDSTTEIYSRRNRFTSIGSSAASMDGFWDANFYRRQSEAGLSTYSKYSDNSVVLTEDTDSFIIGHRIWVGGTKPGLIAYIGETQFAPGDWAGVVLDQPIGKNDGSVGGIRYFQCEAKRGVFSRLTRLTRAPIPQSEMGSGDVTASRVTPTGSDARRPSTASAVSPTGSTRSVQRGKSPPSLSASITSLTSAAPSAEIRIGDRVIIKSSQGSKIGTLRFKGVTDFASGEWCGVELDDPRGKNDGSVDGKRYFECLPNYGLFAPVSKVSKSPSKHKPGACIIHTPGVPSSGIRRAGSRESIISMTSMTSAASSVRRVRLGVTSLSAQKATSPKSTSTPVPTRMALQDVLREKQHHIEQLLKERDLERSEIGKAAAQADEAEKQLLILRTEYDQYRTECEDKLKEHLSLLSQLKLDRGEILSQLEDEKRKNDDLQFRYEETNISKTDIEATNSTYAQKIKELEDKLSGELTKTESLESDSNKLFEAEESLVKMREELEQLKIAYGSLKSKNESVEAEKQTSYDNVHSLQEELERTKRQIQDKETEIKSEQASSSEQLQQLQQEHDKLKEVLNEVQIEKEKVVQTSLEIENNIREELNKKQTEIENIAKERDAMKLSSTDSENFLRQQLENMKQDMDVVLNEKNKIVASSEESEKILNAQLVKLQEDITKMQSENDVNTTSSTETIQQLNKELENSKLNLENVRKEMEKLTLANTETTGTLNKELEHMKLDVEKYKNDHATYKLSTSETIQSLQKELDQIKLDLQQSELEKSKLQTNCEEFKVSVEKLQVSLDEKQSALVQKDQELDDIRKDLTTTKKMFEDQKMILETNSTALSDLETQLKNELEKSRADLSSVSIDLERANEDNVKKINEIDTLKSELSQVQVKKEELLKETETKETYVTKLKQEVENLHKQITVKDKETSDCKTDHESKISEKMNELESLKSLLVANETLTDELKGKLVSSQQEFVDANSLSLERHTREIEQRDLQCAEVAQLLTQKDDALTKTTTELSQLKEQLGEAQQKLQDLAANYGTKEGAEKELLVQLQQSRDELKSKISELDTCKNEFNAKLVEKSKVLEEAESKRDANATELVKLNETLQKLQTELATQDKDAQEKITHEISEREKRFAGLLQDYEDRNAQIAKFEITIMTLEEDACRKNDLIGKLETELESLRQVCSGGQCPGGQATLLQCTQQINLLQVNVNELQQQLKLLQEQNVGLLSDKQKGDANLVLNQHLQLQHDYFLDVLRHILISEQQKQELLIKLKQEVAATNDASKIGDYNSIVGVVQGIGVLQIPVDLSKKLQQTETELNVQRMEVQRLTAELTKVQTVYTQQATNGEQNINNNNYNQQLIEEKKVADGQIQFLNSIIVDMQQKQEEMKSKLLLLESDYSLGYRNISDEPQKRELPPRAYCDICEEFDLHETEDCPKQASDDPPPKPPGQKEKVKPPPRSYCDICEAFGHSTEDCVDDTTF